MDYLSPAPSSSSSGPSAETGSAGEASRCSPRGLARLVRPDANSVGLGEGVGDTIEEGGLNASALNTAAAGVVSAVSAYPWAQDAYMGDITQEDMDAYWADQPDYDGGTPRHQHQISTHGSPATRSRQPNGWAEQTRELPHNVVSPLPYSNYTFIAGDSAIKSMRIMTQPTTAISRGGLSPRPPRNMARMSYSPIARSAQGRVSPRAGSPGIHKVGASG